MTRRWLSQRLVMVAVQMLLVACGASAASIGTGEDTPPTASQGPTLEYVAQASNLRQPVLAWKRGLDDGCQALFLDAQGHASFGPCSGGHSTAAILLEVERPQELHHFLGQYQPFEADTEAGQLVFVGRGVQAATSAERRALAEWASLVEKELQYGRSGASWGLAVALNQEGPSPCSLVQVEVYGKIFANNCAAKIEPLPTTWLDSEQLEQLYAWMDGFRAFDMRWREDGLPMHLVFSGRGDQDAEEIDLDEICDWVNRLYRTD